MHLPDLPFIDVTEIVIDAEFTVAYRVKKLVTRKHRAAATVLRCTEGESGPVQDDPECIAAIGVVLDTMWRAHWRADALSMSAVFTCLRNHYTLTADTPELPAAVIADAAMDLVRESA